MMRSRQAVHGRPTIEIVLRPPAYPDQSSRDWATFGEQSGEQTERNWDALEHAEVNVYGSRQLSGTASHRLGAGRSQVQILSPRSPEIPANRLVFGRLVSSAERGVGEQVPVWSGVYDAVQTPDQVAGSKRTGSGQHARLRAQAGASTATREALGPDNPQASRPVALGARFPRAKRSSSGAAFGRLLLVVAVA